MDFWIFDLTSCFLRAQGSGVAERTRRGAVSQDAEPRVSFPHLVNQISLRTPATPCLLGCNGHEDHTLCMNIPNIIHFENQGKMRHVRARDRIEKTSTAMTHLLRPHCPLRQASSDMKRPRSSTCRRSKEATNLSLLVPTCANGLCNTNTSGCGRGRRLHGRSRKLRLVSFVFGPFTFHCCGAFPCARGDHIWTNM